jgi:hypothetical protein
LKKILVIHADIGAAKNIAKNICLLDESIYFPVLLGKMSRQEYLLNFLYPTNYEDWFSCEYRLKQYTEYGIDMDLGDPRVGSLIPLNTHLTKITQTQRFILDLMDHNTAVELFKQDYVKTLAIAPVTMFGLNWQIRAYTMKYGANRMFNFTFRNEKNIENFKKVYGNNTWVEVNLCNFYDKVRERRRILNRSSIPVMPLELIIWSECWPELISYLEKFFEITIPKDQAYSVLNQWLSLHWPTAETNNWEYRNIFKQYRTLETTNKLALCKGFDDV